MITSPQGWSISVRLRRVLPRPRRRVSMGWWIALPLLLLLLLSVSSIGYLLSHQARQATDRLAAQLEVEVGDRAIEQLESWLREPLLVNQLNQKALDREAIQLEDSRTLTRRFLAQLQTFSALQQLMVVDASGNSVRLSRAAKGGYRLERMPMGQVLELDDAGTVRSTHSASARDLRQTHWYRSAVKQQALVWQDDPKQGIAIAAQSVLNEQKSAVVATALDLSKMNQFLKEMALTPNGQAFVMDQSGILLSTSTAEEPFQFNARGGVEATMARESQDPMTRATAKFLKARWNQIPASSVGAFQLTDRGEKLIVRAERYQHHASADWLVAVVLPERDVLGPLKHRQSETLRLCLFLLLISLVFCIWIVERFVRPIRQLSQAAQAVGQGQWEEVRLPCERGDELGDLARSFSQMSQALQQSFRHLELQNQRLIRQKEHLEDLDRLKDEFLANTSHELRTPLSGIVGLAETMQAQTLAPLQGPQKGLIELIILSARRLSMLVDDILDLSKLQHDKLELNWGSLDLRSLVQHVLAICQPLAEPRQLRLINQIPRTLPLARGDSHRVQQILYNLVGNAIKFTPEGRITVSAKVVWKRSDSQGVSQPWISIRVTDTGIGMEPAMQRRIFEAFEQGQGEMTRSQGGVGLGLAISKAFVELHGGKIDVWSSPGQGSQFCFTLPLFDPLKLDDQCGDEWGEALGEQLGDRHTPPLEAEVASRSGLTLSKHASPEPSSPSQSQSLLVPVLASVAETPNQERLNSNLNPSLAPVSPASPSPLKKKQRRQTAEVSVVGNSDTKSEPLSVPLFSKARILIVDDDLTNLQVLRGQLAMESYEVVEAANGHQALQRLDPSAGGETFDLVILDVMMPQMSGYEVCRKLREDYPTYQLPVIMLTAKVQPQDVVEGFRAGANDYLKKPFSRDELHSRIETHLSNRLYGRFVPEHFLQFLRKSSVADVRLGNHVSCDMTVMFSDIRSFTAFSEAMTPQENFDFINGYLRRVSPEIRSHRGFIVKYLGDGMMAIFPQRSEDAIQAGIAKLRQVRQLNREAATIPFEQSGPVPPIRIGMGIHHGPMMVGIVGEARRMQGDAFSDDVNLTARLEGLTKLYRVSMIISEQVFEQLSATHPFQIRLLDRVRVHGRRQPLTIYEVFDEDPAQALKRQTRDRFEAGIHCYQSRQFVEAQEHFEAVLQIHPTDKTAQLYCDRVATCLSHPPDSDWTGVSNWDEK